MRYSLLSALVVCVVWVASVVFREWNEVQLDLTALYFAARFYGLEQLEQVYNHSDTLLWMEAPPAWVALANELGHPGIGMTSYVYPPLWLPLLEYPASRLSLASFCNIANAFIASGFAIGLLAISHAFSSRMACVDFVFLALVILEFTIIGQVAIELGQPHFLVTGFILVSIAAYIRAAPILAGTFLAVAVAIKISPLLFAVVFLVDRNARALTALGIVGGALLGVSILWAGWPLHLALLHGLGTLDQSVLVSKINLSLQSAVSYPVNVPREFGDYFWTELPSWAPLITMFFTTFAVIGVYAIRWRKTDLLGLLAAFLFLSFVVPLASPLGWVHYLLLSTALAPALLIFRNESRMAMASLICFAGFNTPLYLWLISQEMSYTVYYGSILTCFCMLFALAFGLASGRSGPLNA